MLHTTHKILLLAVALGGAAVGASLLWEPAAPPCVPAEVPAGSPWLFAHRGAPDHLPSPTWVGFTMSGVFESTLPAFERAIARGMVGLDFAVRLTSDDVLVILEDEDVLRTTNAQGLVSALTLQEIEALDAGEGARVPTAAAVFDLYSDRVQYHVRIPASGDEGEAIAGALGALLAERPARAVSWVASDDPRILDAARREAPQLKAALILKEGDAIGAASGHPCLSAVELPEVRVDDDSLSAARSLELSVIATGVQSRARWDELKDAGVRAGLTSFTALPDETPDRLPPQGEVETWE